MDFAGIVFLVVLMSFLSIFLLTPVAKKFGLVDTPNGIRKFHLGEIPLIGGISTYIGLVIGLSLFITPTSPFLVYLLCSTCIVLLGIADDLKDISALVRLGIQALIALFMCMATDLHINNLGDLLGDGEILLDNYSPYLGYFVTVLAVIAAINAFNMIDGIDGLLGITALISFAGMGVLFYLHEDTPNMLLALIISVALLPYLSVNLGIPPIAKRFNKIFMGDTGSMLIGFTVVWLLIQGSQVPAPNASGQPSFSAATALMMIAFPLMDMVRVMIDRIKAGKSPLNADRTHLHHILEQTHSNKRAVLLQICLLSLLFAMLGVALEVSELRSTFIFLFFLGSFALYKAAVNRIIRAPAA